MLRILTIKLLLFLFSLIIGSLAQAIEVCKTCGFSTIKAGVKAAEAGDTVFVKSGIYPEYNILIDKPLTLIGQDMPTIDGENNGEIIRIEADHVTLKGFRIVNVGVSYTTDYAAVRIVDSYHFNLQELVLEKLFFGIYLQKSSHGIVSNNTILGNAKDEYNSGNGIHLWYSKKVLIENNNVQGVRDGIYLEFADSIKVIGNVSKNNLRYGLHFMFSNHDEYSNNTFQNNGAGVAVMFSKHIKMQHNTFKDNWGTTSFGLLLKEINDLEVVGNTFSNNTIAISVEGANRVNYTGNTFRGNGWAIKVRGACYANRFSGNGFYNNAFDLSYNSRLNDNVFERNYWSNYSGYDLDKDGIGDVPYRPVKLFSYIVNRTPEAIVLLRSLFIDIIDFSEKVSPVFTPDELKDKEPLMKPL